MEGGGDALRARLVELLAGPAERYVDAPPVAPSANDALRQKPAAKQRRVCALAEDRGELYAACADDTLWKRGASAGGAWSRVGAAVSVVAMAAVDGFLYAAVKRKGGSWKAQPLYVMELHCAQPEWLVFGGAASSPVKSLAARGGVLYAGTSSKQLLRRAALAAGSSARSQLPKEMRRGWEPMGDAVSVECMACGPSQLFAVCANRQVWSIDLSSPGAWQPVEVLSFKLDLGLAVVGGELVAAGTRQMRSRRLDAAGAAWAVSALGLPMPEGSDQQQPTLPDDIGKAGGGRARKPAVPAKPAWVLAAAKTWYDSNGPFAGKYAMEPQGAVRHEDENDWTVRYNTAPPSGVHRMRFQFSSGEPVAAAATPGNAPIRVVGWGSPVSTSSCQLRQSVGNIASAAGQRQPRSDGLKFPLTGQRIEFESSGRVATVARYLTEKVAEVEYEDTQQRERLSLEARRFRILRGASDILAGLRHVDDQLHDQLSRPWLLAQNTPKCDLEVADPTFGDNLMRLLEEGYAPRVVSEGGPREKFQAHVDLEVTTISEKKGRGLVAARPMPKGTVLLREFGLCAAISGAAAKNTEALASRIIIENAAAEKAGAKSIWSELCGGSKHGESSATVVDSFVPCCVGDEVPTLEEWNTAREQVACNMFTTDTHNYLHSRGSFFNHSCRPNCEWKIIQQSGQFVVRSLRNLRPGEEALISYSDDAASSGVFKCQCDSCVTRSARQDQRKSSPAKAQPVLAMAAAAQPEAQGESAQWSEPLSAKRPRPANPREAVAPRWKTPAAQPAAGAVPTLPTLSIFGDSTCAVFPTERVDSESDADE